jgi:hypothetical protein
MQYLESDYKNVIIILSLFFYETLSGLFKMTKNAV